MSGRMSLRPGFRSRRGGLMTEFERGGVPQVVRLLPDEPVPPYSHVPGRTPYPESDPAGHSFNIPRSTPPPLEPENGPRSRAYLRGLDLFNAGYYG